MFSFAYGQVHEAECISKTETLEAFNHCVKTFEEQRELCSEVKETAEKYQRLFMNEPNINKQTEYSTRREAATRFATGKNPKKIKYIRPKEYYAKQSSQYYPKPGSSEGKIKTKIIGAKRVDKAFADMMKAIFSIGDGMANIPHVKVTRKFK